MADYPRISLVRRRSAMRIAALLLLLLPVLGGAMARGEDALGKIKRRGTLVFGTDATYPPFERKVGDKIEGFDVDLGTEIAREMGARARWENIAWDGIFPALHARKFDLVMSGVTITAERKKGLGFSRPYFLSGQTVVRRRGDGRITGSGDLPGKIVAVQQETTGQYAVEKLGLPGERIRRFETLPDALLDVRNKRADAAVGDLPALRDLIRKGFPELEIVGGVFVRENVGIVARPADTALLRAVNDALARLLADGRYARIYAKWMLEPLPADYAANIDKVREEGTPVQNAPAGDAASGSAFTLRWDLLREALPILLRGAQTTLTVTLLTLLLGVPLGLLVALLRLSALAPLRLIATIYVEAIRGTPLLLQIFVIYFVLPAVGVSLPQFVAAVTALTLNAAAYISEIFRAGIESIDAGQTEAARALGMDYRSAMRWVILPQTLRRVLPPLTNEAVALLKDSSLISVIGLTELTRVGREVSSNSGSPITIYLAVAVLYLAMTLPLTHLVRRLEVRWQPVSRPRGVTGA
jgi:arginine/lysine/histidine/glutamine transport system substrate-binding/permease protein